MSADGRNVPPRQDGGPAIVARGFLGRVGLMAVLWMVLTGGDPSGWAFALLVIGLAALTSLRTIPPGRVRLSPAGILRFFPFFLLYSIRGGIDVATRAMRPTLDLEAGTIAFRTRLPAGPPRSFFAAVIGLQPGTLTARLAGDLLRVHVLDLRLDAGPQLREIEARVADLFGVELAKDGEG